MPTFVIDPAEAGQTVAAVLRQRFALSWSEARRRLRAHTVRLGGQPCADPTRRVAAGQCLEVLSPLPAKPPRHGLPRQGPGGCANGSEPIVRFADAHVVVVDKPAGLTTMRHPQDEAQFGARARRFLPPTLADLLPELLAGRRGRCPSVRAVHRLDKETSGLVVFARTIEAERHLGHQFRAHTIERTYVAVVRGQAQLGRIASSLVEDRGDGRRGSSPEPSAGKPAVTHVRLIEELGDYTVIECRLETGRTHQVRIHLAERGTPLCGERVYDRPLHGKPLPDHSGAPRVALHAARLGFIHPASETAMSWDSPLPDDLQRLVKRLRTMHRRLQGGNLPC